MTEKTDAEAMDLMVKMVTEENSGDDTGKSGSIDLDLDMSEFIAESRVESIIINNIRNDTTKAKEGTVSSTTETDDAGTRNKTDAEISTDLRVTTPTAPESKPVEMPAIEPEKMIVESDKLPVSETSPAKDDQSKSTLCRDEENDVINIDQKPYLAPNIDMKHNCLACYYCPNSLNPKLRQFTRLEQKIIHHIVEYRDLVLNQPIIILKRCDNLAKNMSITTKRHLDIEKPAIMRENCFEEKKRHLEKEMKAKIQKISAEKAKAREVDAQKSLYNKLLKRQPPMQHGKISSAEKTAKLHSVPKPDLSTKISLLNASSSSAKPELKTAKVADQKSKFHSASKLNVPQQVSKAVNKVDPQARPLMSISFNNVADSAVKKPVTTPTENEGTNESTLDDKNKDLNSFKIKKLDKKNFHRKTTNYISPLDQILYETNRFQTAASPANKSTPPNNPRKRPLNDKIVGESFANSQAKKPKMPEDVIDNGRMIEPYEKPPENLTRSLEVPNDSRPPLLDRSPPPCGADFDSSPSPSYSSANADYAAAPFRANNSSSRLDSIEAAMNLLSKTDVSEKLTFPHRATNNIPGIYGSSPYENGNQARHSSVEKFVGDTWSSRSQEDIPVTNERKCLLDRDFKEIVHDTSLMSLFQQAGSCLVSEQKDRTYVEATNMPETLESFLDDIVRKRKSGVLGDEFVAKEITSRQSLLGTSPLEFPNALNHILDFRRQSQEDHLLRGSRTPPLVAVSSSSAVPSRPVLLPNTDPYSLAASAIAKPEQARPTSSLSAAASQNDSMVNIAAMRKYPMLEDFIKPATSDSYIGNAHRRTTLFPDVFPSTSATASYPSSSYPLIDRQINKSSNNNDITSNLDVRQLLSGQTSSSASLRMSDAESYFMSNVSTNDLSSILKQLEKEEQKIRQNKLAKETETPREVDIAKLYGPGVTQTVHDTFDDDDDVQIPMPNSSSIDSRPVNEMPPPLSSSVTFSQLPTSSSSSLILAQNSAVDKWADEMLEKLQRDQSIGRENDSLDEILKKITSSNRNKGTSSAPLNVHNATNSSKKFPDNSSASMDDDSSIHQTLSALRLLLDAGSDQRAVKKVENFIKEATPPPSTSTLHPDSNGPRPHHDLLFDRYRLTNEINEILGSKDEFFINHFVRTLQQELACLRSPEPRAAPDELLQMTAVFDTMLCEPTSILNRDVGRRREVERILPLLRTVGNLGSEELQNVVMTPVMLFLQDLIEKSLA